MPLHDWLSPGRVAIVDVPTDRAGVIDAAARLLGGVGVQRLAGQDDGGFRAVVGLVEAQQRADLEGLVEVALQARQPGFNVVAEGGGDLDLLAVDFDTHRGTPPTSRLGPQHIAVDGRFPVSGHAHAVL